MSRSPKDSRTTGDAAEYSNAWEAITQLVRGGRSWSGHERHCAFLNCGPADAGIDPQATDQPESRESKNTNRHSTLDTRHSTTPHLPFANISSVSGLDFADDGRAAALTDWDHDGDLDIWLYNRTGPRLRLMINRTAQQSDPRDAAFVALRLRGTRCNRDAIGARVEVVAGNMPPDTRHSTLDTRKSIQTLRAGDGFLSQSSKWLHFGLGAATRISAVRVRWPGGETESFSGLRPGQRYILEQGRGAAIEWTRPSVEGGLRLEASTQESHEKTSSAQVLLPDPVVLPILRYALFDGSPRRIEPRGGPTLVNFWASWCMPCVAELKGLKASEQRLRGAGLSILALSVDGLEEDGPTDQADGQRLLERVEFPFESGAATAELLDKVDLMVRFLFDRHPTFAVPTSLLLDPQGRLAAIYRGPVDAERLLRDVAALDLPAADRRRLGEPMPGRRYGPHMALQLDDLARRFSGRYQEDHLRFLRLAADEADAMAAQLDPTQLPEAQRQSLANFRSEAHYKLAAALNGLGHLDEAIDQLRIAITVKPDYAQAFYNLATLLQKRGDTEEAIDQFRRALVIDPNHAGAHFNLANALRAVGRVDDAVSHYRRVLQIAPAHARAQNNLALALRSQGRVDEAVTHFREAIRIAPQNAAAHYNLAATLRSQGRMEEAVKHYRLALAIAPDRPRVLRGLAATLAARGEHGEARVHLARALELVTAAGNKDAAGAIRAQMEKLD